jgi:hypothetical protein
MKTTIELPADLLMEAKIAASRRRTTLKAMIEHALRRELAPPQQTANPAPEKFEIGPLGFLVLKRGAGETITLDTIKEIEAELDEEELRRAIHPPRA